MKSTPRPFRTAAAASAGLTLTLWLSVGVALASPGPSAIRLAAWAGADYATEGGSFVPIDTSLVRELAGDRLARLLDVGPRNPATTTMPPRTDRPAPDPGVEPPPAGVPMLAVTITADRAAANQGDQIVYTVTTTNIGTAKAERVRVESHVPEGTGLVGWSCDGEVFLVDMDRRPISCVDANNVQVADAPNTGGHLVRFAGAELPVGDSDVWRFAVRVYRTTPRGTVLENHGHAEATGLPRTTSRTVRVEVR